MTNTPYRDKFHLPNGFDEEVLQEWYMFFKPEGSGPLSMMRRVCALLEEVAELKQICLVPDHFEGKGDDYINT